MHSELPQKSMAPASAPPQKLRGARPILLVLTAAATLAFGLSVGYKLRSGWARGPFPVSLPPQLTEGQAGQSLLTDSILSIVQSYYVDPSRVDNQGLLESVVSALAANPRIKAGNSPGGLWVDIDGERQLFPLKAPLKYQDVLDVFQAVSRRLDDLGLKLVTGEGHDKRASAGMTLLNALLGALDAHSSLLSQDAYRELRQGTEGAFGGLGVLVGIRDNLLTVIKPLPRSPAARVGIKKRDRILGIGATFTYGQSLDDLVEYMRGEPGTDVRLSLLRDGALAPADIVLKREVVHVDSVTAQDINRPNLKALHLTIDNFASRTSREVLAQIKKYKARHAGILGALILDLRSNPGGLLDQAVQVADLFLESGVIVTTKGRREEVESAGSGFDEVSFPMAVLIDGDSASASEIVAGALQDHERALIIGQPSFGKGSVQTIFELPGERALKLTIARYYTPAGRSIQNVGIIPDLWLQPLAKGRQNDNLLGAYRYKNERFLRHHLHVETDASALPPRTAARKAYYLTEPSTEATPDTNTTSSNSDQAQPQSDQELELALEILTKVRTTYGAKLPPGTLRASHWLGLAGPTVVKKLAAMDDQVSLWLKKHQNIDWAKAPGPSPSGIVLRLGPMNPTQVYAGDTLKLAWTIENPDSYPLPRASVYLRSDSPGIETKEVLAGWVPPKSELSGVISVPVAALSDPSPILLRVGVAVDAWPWPEESAAKDYQVQVLGRPVAEIMAATELIEEVGGRIAHVLEGKEKARVKVGLRNIGKVAAKSLTVRVINLSGSQVKITQVPVKVEALAPGESSQVLFDVEASSRLVTGELSFGLEVASASLKVPLRQRFSFQSRPTTETALKGTVSH